MHVANLTNMLSFIKRYFLIPTRCQQLFREVVDDDFADQRFENVPHSLFVVGVGEVGIHGLPVGEGEQDADIE